MVMAHSTLPESSDKNAVDEIVAPLRALIDFVEANPELAGHFRHGSFSKVLIYAGGIHDPREVMAEFIRAGLATGAKVTKDFDGDNWANVHVKFGPIDIEVYGKRAEVCERVVVGTEEVEEEVADPEALAAVPKVKVTKTVEQVKWVCHPLLADAPGRRVMTATHGALPALMELPSEASPPRRRPARAAGRRALFFKSCSSTPTSPS
jgi:hypothetical protein